MSKKNHFTSDQPGIRLGQWFVWYTDSQTVSNTSAQHALGHIF